MEILAYWWAVGTVLWFSMPALAARKQVALGVLLALLVPLISWVWLTRLGVRYRRACVELEQRHDEVIGRQRLARDVAFWRDRARAGTPAEQEAARMYLEALGYAVEPGPAERHADQLATASSESLAEMSRHYQAVLHAGALTSEGQAAYRAVQNELARRHAESKYATALEPGHSGRTLIVWDAPGGLPVVHLPGGGQVQVTEQQARDLTAAWERQAQHKLRGNR